MLRSMIQFLLYVTVCMCYSILHIDAENKIKPQYSFAKWGNIFLKRCPQDITNVFPLNQHPSTWQSCEDAYEYTWTHNDDSEEEVEVELTLPNGEMKNHRYISDLSEIDQLKLIRSTGFCPHRRCQLGNATRRSNNGNDVCPVGLCYTQLEEGSPSFGACCYDSDGMFNSGNLIGYFYKTQPTPKPIYKHSRIVLAHTEWRAELERSVGKGNGVSDDISKTANYSFENGVLVEKENTSGNQFDSYERFINANLVMPGIIITQCPLTGFPAGFDDTVTDMMELLVQSNASLYIQMMNVDNHQSKNGPIRNCELFPSSMLRIMNNHSEHSHGFSVENMIWRSNHTESIQSKILVDQQLYVSQDTEADPSLTGDVDAFTNITFDIHWNPHLLEVPSRRQSVQYIWYSDWHDFGIPPLNSLHDETVRKISIRAAEEILNGHSIVLSCSSGRGRSGTFAAIIAGYVHQLNLTHFEKESEFEVDVKSKKLSQLVDLIVKMRSNRDGIVELPVQFHYIRRILGLL